MERLCLWCGPLFLVLFGTGFVACAQFLPAPPPTLSPDDVASIFRDRTSMVRIGVVLMWFAAGLMVPWVGLISMQMRRIPGSSLALVYAQLAAGCAGAVILTLVATIWGIAAFRPDRDPAITQLINDAAWILLIAPVPIAVVQPGVIGLAILGDRSAAPLFPRWGGYLNLWIALLFVPGFAALFFKSGAFAWNGVLPYWIPVGAFGAWFAVMFVLLKGALGREDVRQPA